ncbi:MAG TPA: hypothetical protein PKD09_13395 [Aggregatilinea sp.]|jgi:uncharacterized OB-fold protein|uniref:hypothetical protein n=1 Tax=Aggregatilinea sp. TaxID=2806333 RepID=UPI002C51A7FD|nr:hypothetical protein [Aggregatilinea sp.]HML22641.1 hypothetical protein [Aggregatilinea sp.]
MDITRNWRLKMTRGQMFAARCPETGTVILPQQTSFASHGQPVELYFFDLDGSEPVQLAEVEADYARAAAR